VINTAMTYQYAVGSIPSRFSNALEGFVNKSTTRRWVLWLASWKVSNISSSMRQTTGDVDLIPSAQLQYPHQAAPPEAAAAGCISLVNRLKPVSLHILAVRHRRGFKNEIPSELNQKRTFSFL